MSVLKLNVTHVGEWECDTCCDDYDAANGKPWETEHGDFVCIPTCIQGQFEKALEFDYNWPARFGGDELKISDFESVLSPELVSALRAKAAEMAAIDKTSLLEAVKGLTRGKDYQICPGCQQTIDLGSGCNHMTCHFCHAHFCFLCGEEVKEPEETDHWTVSRNVCPRYGPVGSGNFDDDDFSDYSYDSDDDQWVEHPFPEGVIFDETDSQLAFMPEWVDENRARMFDFISLHIETWTWNVTMQSLRNDRTRQQQLRLVLERGETDARPLWNDNFEALFRQYHPEHSIQEQDWEAVVQEGMPRIQNIFDNGPGRPLYHDPTAERDVQHLGLLTQPVGAVFNMMSRYQRSQAVAWMCNTTRDWQTLSGPQRSAVFDMGPGGDHVMRLHIAQMMRKLYGQVDFEHFTFTPMQHAGLLVTAGPPLASVEAQDGSVFVPGEAYWRRVILREFWGGLVHLDQDMRRDPRNIVWRDLMQDASDAWLEQRPDGALGEELNF